MATLAVVPRITERPADLIRVAVPRLNKNNHISQYLSQLETRDYDINWARVTETRQMNCTDWNEFVTNLLSDRDWLSGKGGADSWAFTDAEDLEFFKLSEAERNLWKNTSFLLVVAVVAPTGQVIYVDPEGYDYARYLAFPADELPEGKTRAEREREQQKAELEAKKAEIQRRIDNPPTVPADHGLRFLWNGIKVKGELYRCWYSLGNTYHYPADTISVSARDYKCFPAEVRACFHVENNTDLQSDYFDEDRLRVCSNHPLYSLVREAYQAQEAHNEKRIEKRAARNRHGSIDA